MKLLNLRPMLWVNDVKASINWYVNVLDFTEGNYVEEWQWGVAQKDEVEIMFARPTEHTPYNSPAFTGSLYINVDDVESLYDKLKTHPDIYYKMETFEYGMKEFAIKDLNGYILQFGQNVSES